MSLTVVTMATSRHLAVIKVNRFKRIITKRGACLKAKKKGKDYPVGPVLLGFFMFVVTGSSLFKIIRTATTRAWVLQQWSHYNQAGLTSTEGSATALIFL